MDTRACRKEVGMLLRETTGITNGLGANWLDTRPGYIYELSRGTVSRTYRDIGAMV